MLSRKCLASLVACAALAAGGLVARAAEPTDLTLNQPVVMDDSSAQPAVMDDTPVRPLTAGLNAIPGVGTGMSNLNLGVKGYFEGSYTYDTSTRSTNPLIAGRVFDQKNDSPQFNQLDLQISRSVDATKGKFDVGFVVEMIYGSDAAFTHSNGMTVYSPSKTASDVPSSGGITAITPKNQFDLPQAYLTFAVPVGSGLTVDVGKFYALIGYETTDPTQNNLYSHSYMFGELPFTQTGVTAAYALNSDWSVLGGFSRGWDQSLKDNNGSLDILGQVSWTHGKYSGILNITSGDEVSDNTTNAATGGSRDGWRTVLDAIFKVNVSDQLTLGFNADYGWEAQADPTNGSTAQWYGAAVYAGYQLSDMFGLNGRVEWFDDPKGGAPTALDNTVYEATMGVTIKPMPSNKVLSYLSFRPEVRYDYSNTAFFNGGADHNQLTAALDMLFQY